ncbi:MAG: hypothetical protein JSS42_07255 [Proteobacteria bacterium]|nr:hypothetical protein [Pseudomonadota bacterium]
MVDTAQTQGIPLAEVQAMLAQECDPNSALRQSLDRGLRELDAGEGIADEDLSSSPDRPSGKFPQPAL